MSGGFFIVKSEFMKNNVLEKQRPKRTCSASSMQYEVGIKF